MQFMDDSLLPENQDPLVIQVAPYAPSFLPRDSDDIAVTLDEQVQKAVDCYNAGATVLHVHVREPDGSGSKRLSMFNEMLARLRDAVPKCIRRGDLDACAVTRAQFDEVAGPHRAALRALAARYPNVALADPSGFFCDEQRCPATRGDLALYRDDYHVTATAAAAFARTPEAAVPH